MTEQFDKLINTQWVAISDIFPERKRQYLVDTGGRLCAVVVHAANVADGKGSLTLLDRLDSITERLEKFLGDTSTSYNRVFADAIVKKGYSYENSARIGGNPDSTILLQR